MKKTFKMAWIAVLSIFVMQAAHSQEWTKAQSEVWQVVENTWMKWKQNDIAGSTASLHAKYQGWNSMMPLPISKSDVIKMDEEMKDKSKILQYSINPARIVVTENAAVVHYYFYISEEYTYGEKKEVNDYSGKNTDFFIKEEGKWMLLGDMTYLNQKDSDD